MNRHVLAGAVMVASGTACALALPVAVSYIVALLPMAVDAARRLGL